MEQVITQLAIKILLDDYSGYYEMRRQIILQLLYYYYFIITEIIIDIVYDLDKDWFRIFALERDIY